MRTSTAPALEQLRRAYETNVFGLVAVTQAFLPGTAVGRRIPAHRQHLQRHRIADLDRRPQPAVRLGASARDGGLAYRSSKTAVNAVTLLTAQALGDRFKVNALAPGLRRTNLIPGMTVGGDPAEAATGAVRLALLPDDGPTGALWSWDGSRVPW